MDRAAWLDAVRESMVGTWRLITESSEGAQAFERDGLFAAVVPVSPDRSVMNSVIYSDREALLGSLGELARTYEEAGIRAWTVWVPEDDAEVPAPSRTPATSSMPNLARWAPSSTTSRNPTWGNSTGTATAIWPPSAA